MYPGKPDPGYNPAFLPFLRGGFVEGTAPIPDTERPPTMIKFFALIARAEAVTSQEFHDHWRHPHGSMGRLIPSQRFYVQSHHLPNDHFGPDQAMYEGIAETGFDTVEDALGFGTEPQYVNHVQPDEPNFVGPGLEWLYADEEVLQPRYSVQDGASYADANWSHLDRPYSIKVLQFIRRNGNPDWRGTNDAELGRRIGALRHVRNTASAAVHGDDAAWLGARELWWPTFTAFQRGVAADPEAFRELISRAGESVTLLAQAERFLR